MASSQVEIASSSPFGCVLRDRNQHNGCRTRDTNAFQKNFNDLVQNQLSSCRNAGPNENSHPSIDFADLWVHQPQTSTNENNHHARETGNGRISENSNSNENSHQHIDYADLWVHNPQRNNDDHNHKKSNPGEKCDRARDTVPAVERKSETGVSTRPLTHPPRGRSYDGAQSQPVSRVRSPESLRPASSSRRRRSLGSASSGPSSTSQKGKSPNIPAPTSQTESSVEVSNLGAVSSLVRKWRKFEGKSRSSGCISKSNSGSALADAASFAEAYSRDSEAGDESSDVVRPDTPTISEEGNGDWESVRTGFSVSPGRDFDTTSEKERIRVADIIRKLSSNGNGEEQNDREHSVCHESLPRVRTSVDQSEQRPFSPICCSPRIRGRQAFCDFQMQMERERHKELEDLVAYKAVSKFSHRGRIQAMLRVRFLHRGAEAKDGQRPNCKSSNLNGLKQSAIMHLREIFNLGAKHCASHFRSPQGKVVDCNTVTEKSSVSCQQIKENSQKKLTERINPPIVESVTSAHAESSSKSNSVEQDINKHESNDMVEQSAVEMQSSEREDNQQPELPQQENAPATVSKGSSDIQYNPEGDTKHLEHNPVVHNNTLSLHNSENLYQEARSDSDDVKRCSSSDSCIHKKPEFLGTGTSFKYGEGNVMEFQEAKNRQLAGNGNELIDEISEAQGDWEEKKDNNHSLDCSWVSDVFHQLSGFGELQSDYHQQDVEINHDWINDVSRPRSAWEDLRQARYQEMLDPFMQNDEIRRLLQRKNVSNFLSSNMRERIDHLMMSRTQQLSRTGKLEVEADQGKMKEEKEEHGEGEEDEYKESNEEEEEEEEEEDDDDSTIYNDDYEDQEHVMQMEQDNAAKSYEGSDNYSDAAASPYIQQSPLTNVGTLESQRSINHHSVEMELIYELKGNMEQLHQEISEIRRSIKSCVDMQMELQQSIKQEFAAVLCQPGKQKKRDRKDSGRGRCCICYEMPIDSLLYRCGHMCTCFTCAHELQWGTGKCPVCRAPILDVVRAYAHS